MSSLNKILGQIAKKYHKLKGHSTQSLNEAYFNLLLNFENKQEAVNTVNAFILNSFRILNDALNIK